MKKEINKLVRLNMYIPHQSWCANEFRTVSLYLVCCIHSLTIYVPSKRCKCGNLWVVQCMFMFLCSGRSQCSLSMSTLWTLSNTIFTVPQLVMWFIHTIAMAKDCKNWSLVSHSHCTMRRTSLHACSVLGSFVNRSVVSSYSWGTVCLGMQILLPSAPLTSWMFCKLMLLWVWLMFHIVQCLFDV